LLLVPPAADVFHYLYCNDKLPELVMRSFAGGCFVSVQLITLATDEERNAIRNELSITDYALEAWVGLESVDRKTTQDPTLFRWLSTGRTPDLSWWDGYEPNNFKGSEGVCAVQSSGGGFNGKELSKLT
jgi:hypothetical protein